MDMERVVLYPDREYEPFLAYLHIYSPPLAWRLLGPSLLEVLSRGYEVSYRLTGLWAGYIPSKRVPVEVVGENSDGLFLVENILGSPKGLMRLVDDVFSLGGPVRIVYNDVLVGWLGEGKGEEVDITGYGLTLFRRPWDLMDFLGSRLFPSLLAEVAEYLGLEEVVEGLYVGRDVEIDLDKTYIDVDEGPILILDGCEVIGFNHLVGPLIIGESSWIYGAKLSRSIVGPVCKLGGEVSDSVILGYTNSAHHSYIGHSLLGFWVNIGAGTVLSDLKNTYGEVRVKWGGGVSTGRIKLGSFLGDHVKTSINTSIYGGSVVGVSTHLHGLVDRSVPPFRIYRDGEEVLMDIEKAMEIARRMYSRRGVEWDDCEEALWRNRYLMFV